MGHKGKRLISLKWALSASMAVCWAIPILTVVLIAGVLLNRSYESNLRDTVENSTEHAVEQVCFHFRNAMEASRALSYDGKIKEAYQNYLEDGDQVDLFGITTDYLSQRYSRDENIRAVFLSYLDQVYQNYTHIEAKGATSYSIMRWYRETVKKQAMDIAAGRDTGIEFFQVDGEIFMVRNLLDSQLKPYGVLVVYCSRDALLGSLSGIPNLARAELRIDGMCLSVDGPMADVLEENASGLRQVRTESETQVDGHTLSVTVSAVGENLWGAMPELRWAIILILLCGIPFVGIFIAIFYRQVGHPVETLADASGRVKQGERGYMIHEEPHNQEIGKLITHFNAMSLQLEQQFRQLYEEQQAVQEAKIKALQSQINPHFLGNTLEIINWEARLEENTRVSAMIEALATMLNGAIGRDGRVQVPLKEELSYLDAYLYITKERLGDRLTITREIDESMLDCMVPRLMLQPLAENAVDHDIAAGNGSRLCIRAYQRDTRAVLEIAHDGILSEKDRESIRKLLATVPPEDAGRGHVGLRNLNQRIKLLYGGSGTLTINEGEDNNIVARVEIPMSPNCTKKDK